MGLKLPKSKHILNEVSLDNVLDEMKLQPATDMILDAYHREGYFGGDFENAHFTVDKSKNSAIIFVQPYYSQFMLYGRRAGKMPPIEPIANWTKKYGIDINPWIIAKHISKYGTKGNDFISPIMPKVSEFIASQLKTLTFDQIIGK